MRIFVAGATGLIGTSLVQRLCDRQDEVVVLTRHPIKAKDQLDRRCLIIEGDPTKLGAWMLAVQRCDAVINLAGENIFARRWSTRFKKLLRDSRVESTINIVQALAASPINAQGVPKILVNASAVGYYGARGDEELTEADPPGHDFLANLCIAWERAAQAAELFGVRVAMVRTGIVLDSKGGALRQMLPLFKYFLGGPAGSGRQWMSWIHHEDLIGTYLLALENPLAHGPINGAAPAPVTNRLFTEALGRVLHRPVFLRTPKFALRLALGQVAEAITSGQRVVPRQLMIFGYSFRFPELSAALNDLLRRGAAGG
jgi:uncharacterized protein (TIGR01777 family)